MLAREEGAGEGGEGGMEDDELTKDEVSNGGVGKGGGALSCKTLDGWDEETGVALLME